MSTHLKDGVYLGLGEAEYFAERRLGSTDLCKLYLQKEGWYWSSFYNEAKVQEEDAGARVFGRALHCRLLEGEDAYQARFSKIPDKAVEAQRHGDKFCVTVKDICEALEKRGMNPKATSGKDYLIDYCRTRAPDLVIWDALLETWGKQNVGRGGVTEAEDGYLKIMVDAVRGHKEIGQLFAFGPSHVPLPEVSILWHDEHGIPRRARLDQMLPQTTIDLKALANVGGRPLAFATGEALAKWAYHVQLSDHYVARHVAYRFLAAGEGNLFGGTPEERAWILRFPAEAPNFDYAWIYYQRPDVKRGLAPIVFPWGEDRGSELHLRGIRCRREAIQTYRRCMAEFGPNVPWTRVEPLHTTTETAKHRVFVPHYVGGDEWVAGEEEDI